ncbi:MAG TPA: hypothetical protein VF759_06250 [Allosphingosinicella sp.]|jgi:hypothetical protein
MSFALVLAAFLSASPAAEARTRVEAPVNRSLSDVDRLNELKIDVNAALAKGLVDRPTAAQFHFGIERIRRQMVRMGMQVGYRQRIRVRARIDALQARWEARKALNADIRSGK